MRGYGEARGVLTRFHMNFSSRPAAFFSHECLRFICSRIFRDMDIVFDLPWMSLDALVILDKVGLIQSEWLLFFLFLFFSCSQNKEHVVLQSTEINEDYYAGVTVNEGKNK